MSKLLIFDTSIFVDDLRTGCHQHRMGAVQGVFRLSAVVMAELWRGVRSSAEREFLLKLEQNHPMLTPTGKNWRESGRILQAIGRSQHFDPARLRNLHFDVLIALTARAHGARLITSNRTDFELIQRYRDFELEVWAPC